MMTPITGKTLIDWGFQPGRWFGEAIKQANALRAVGRTDDQIKDKLREMEPQTISLRSEPLPYKVILEPENEIEIANLAMVTEAMNEIMRLPTAKLGAVMPDACPAGVIPVGGVVATEGTIHPGLHSADVCCSMAVTILQEDIPLKEILDVAQLVTHFGPGGRPAYLMSDHLTRLMEGNPFTKELVSIGHEHMITQGDGNHFLYVGRVRSLGLPAIVTHHGSRGVGASLYNQGMAAARLHTKRVAPEVPVGAAFLEFGTQVGQDYWEALQIVREWTKENHFRLHDLILYYLRKVTPHDRFWNEHNFVFRRTDGLFYHAKGATPSFHGWAKDADDRTLIPMNMAEPILITRVTESPASHGFAPHGAGRNMSRSRFKRENPEAALPTHIDARFYTGKPDPSEFPGAYKSSEGVINQITKHGLAEIIDFVDPYGSIMAGEISWTPKT